MTLDDFQGELKFLTRAVREPAFRFVIIEYNHTTVISRLRETLHNQYPDRPLQEISLRELDYRTLVDTITDFGRGILLLRDFETLFADENQDLCVGFNQRRDYFARMPIALLALMPRGYLRLLPKRLPDWWSVRSLDLTLDLEVMTDRSFVQLERPEMSSIGGSTGDSKKAELERLLTELDEVEPDNLLLINNLYLQILDLCDDLGLYEKGLAYAQNFLAFAQQNKYEQEDPETLGQTYYKLGNFYRQLGQYQAALEAYTVGLKIAETHRDERQVNRFWNDLALLYRDLGEYERARDLLEKAMASDAQNFGENHPSTAVSYSNLATVLKNLGDYQGAKDLLQKALASNEQNFGENHPSTAVSYSNLALVLQDLGDYQGAKDLLQKAMASDAQNFGENHPSTARSYSNLATVLRDLGDYQGAKDLLQKALASDEQNFGENHPSTAVRYSNLATVLQDLGDYQGAKDLLQKALASDEQNFGENHPTTAVRYSNLALVLQDLGDYAGAIPLLEKAYAVYQHQLGDQHPQTKIIKGNLDVVLQASKPKE